MKNMKVSMKLITGFLIVVILAAAVGALGIFSLLSAAENTALLAERTEIAIISARMNRNIQAQRAGFRGAAVYQVMGMIAERDRNLAEVSALEADYQELHDQVAPMLITETGLRLMAAIDSAYEPFAVARDVFEEAIIDPNTSDETMVGQLDDVAATVAPLAESIAALVDFADTLTTDMAIEAEATATRTTIIQVSVLGVVIAISAFLALYLSRLISRPLAPLTMFMKKAGETGDIELSPEDVQTIEKFGRAKDEIGQTIAATASFITHINKISKVLETIAGGDLTVDVAPLSEKDVLGLSLQRMTDSLNSMFGNINMSSAQVSMGAGQVADGAQALAQGSTEQAATVQELSGAVSEVSDKTRANAEMAEKAARLADTIKGNAEKGSRQMDDMTMAVKQIDEASQSIGKVIKAIDDIAFQTNILALNAAVEAARAGQHGKGFAVVADEVRNLAAKSAAAAKESESLIADSVEKAKLGVQIAGETSASLSEIVSGINESTLLVAEIANSSTEQAHAITQINNGIDQVAQVVQQNSATAEQSAAASQEMSGQSQMLREQIATFKIKDDNSGGIVSGTGKTPRGTNSGFSLNTPGRGSGKY